MRIKFFQQRASTFIGLGRQSLVLHEHAVHRERTLPHASVCASVWGEKSGRTCDNSYLRKTRLITYSQDTTCFTSMNYVAITNSYSAQLQRRLDMVM